MYSLKYERSAFNNNSDAPVKALSEKEKSTLNGNPAADVSLITFSRLKSWFVFKYEIFSPPESLVFNTLSSVSNSLTKKFFLNSNSAPKAVAWSPEFTQLTSLDAEFMVILFMGSLMNLEKTPTEIISSDLGKKSHLKSKL